MKLDMTEMNFANTEESAVMKTRLILSKDLSSDEAKSNGLLLRNLLRLRREVAAIIHLPNNMRMGPVSRPPFLRGRPEWFLLRSLSLTKSC